MIGDTMQVTGEFDVPLAAGEAFWLFTPEGERGWIPGWDPGYPAGDPSDAAGTVFVTETDEAATIWVITELDRARRSATYARVTPGAHAGTVRVRCLDDRPGHCRVAVTYDLTALGDEESLDDFSERFPAIMAAWKAAIEAYVGDDHPKI